MAENWPDNQTTQAIEARTQAVDEGLRIYMTKVYNYMGLGLLATALTAYLARHQAFMCLAQTPLFGSSSSHRSAWCFTCRRACIA